jgi:type VI secretion system protein VasD
MSSGNARHLASWGGGTKSVTIRSRICGALMMAALVAVLSGCGSTPPPPTTVELTAVAAPDVNPDPSGRPSPIVVRIYQLAATGAFESADYFQLHDKEAAVLGANLLDRQELALTPGTSEKLAITAKPGITAIGVAAAYRDIDRAQWRADAPIPPNKKTTLKVDLGKLVVSVGPDAK